MALTKVPSNLDSVTATTQSASDNSTNVATTAYVTTAVANLVDGAPSTLNTLNEIAAALNDDAALNTTLTNSIATKLPLAGGTLTGGLGATTITSDVSDGTAITLKRSGGTAARFGVASGPVGFIVLNDTTSDNVAALKGTSGAILPSTNAGADKDGTMSLGSSSVKFNHLYLSGKSFIGSGFILDPDSSGRIGMNRNPANGNATASSSLQRIQINGPSASGDYLDIQNYNSGGTYQGSLRISGGNAYLNGSNDMRIKLGDSGIAGISDSNNTVHIRGDNDGLKLNAAANGYILSEINGVRAMNIASNGRVSVGTSALGTAQTEIKVPAGVGGLYVTTSSSNNVISAFQTLSCVNTLSATNTWHDVAYVSHSPNIRVIGKSYQSNNAIYGGASAEYTLLGHYGSVSTTNNKQYALAMNGGDTTADLEYRYLNSGASSGSYRLQVKMGYSGGTHTVYTAITGFGAADFYED